MALLSRTFKALGDETRREILSLLAGGHKTAGEIADAFSLSKSTISHHLNVLKEAGLVTDQKKGQFIIYTLNIAVFQEIKGWILEISGPFKDIKKNHDSGIF